MVTTFQTAYKYKWRKSNVYNYCVNADFGPNESKGKCSFIWWIEPPGWSNRVPNFKGVLLIFPKCGFYEMTLGFPFYTAHGLFQSIGLQSRGVIFVYIYIPIGNFKFRSIFGVGTFGTWEGNSTWRARPIAHHDWGNCGPAEKESLHIDINIWQRTQIHTVCNYDDGHLVEISRN